MKLKKILAGVLTVSVVCCLMITYTGSSSGTPPTEEEFLAQSHGLVVTSNKETVYPDEEGMWRYRLSISPEGDSGVLVQKLEIKYYTFGKEYVLDETFDGNDFKDWWGSPYIQAGQTRSFGAGLPSRNNIYYRDHIFIGIDDRGNAVKGTIRIHFSKEKQTIETSVGGPPTEQEFLAQSQGLIVTSNKETVYPDSENAWRYRLSISPEGDSGVLMQKLEMKYYSFSKEYVLDETFDGNDFKDWWGSPYIQARQTKNLGAGLSSRSSLYYRDHIFIGIDDMGNEVKGTIRVHFSKEEAPPSEQETEGSLPEGVPVEEEFLAQSHGLVVTNDQHTVPWDKEKGWRWTLKITPEKGLNVTLQQIKIRYVVYRLHDPFEEVYGEDFIERVWRTCRIQAGEVREFTAGMGPSSTPADFDDYIFTGIDDDGNEVKGTIRVYFAESEQ